VNALRRFHPQLQINSLSKFVIVWGADGGGGLIGALFDLESEPISGEFAVSSPGASSATFPAAAHMAGGPGLLSHGLRRVRRV
jgi:hypothetical protein